MNTINKNVGGEPEDAKINRALYETKKRYYYNIIRNFMAKWWVAVFLVPTSILLMWLQWQVPDVDMWHKMMIKARFTDHELSHTWIVINQSLDTLLAVSAFQYFKWEFHKLRQDVWTWKYNIRKVGDIPWDLIKKFMKLAVLLWFGIACVCDFLVLCRLFPLDYGAFVAQPWDKLFGLRISDGTGHRWFYKWYLIIHYILVFLAMVGTFAVIYEKEPHWTYQNMLEVYRKRQNDIMLGGIIFFILAFLGLTFFVYTQLLIDTYWCFRWNFVKTHEYNALAYAQMATLWKFIKPAFIWMFWFPFVWVGYALSCERTDLFDNKQLQIAAKTLFVIIMLNALLLVPCFPWLKLLIYFY